MGAQEAPADLKAEMMVEWLTGEAGGLEVNSCIRHSNRSDISRTNSMAGV